MGDVGKKWHQKSDLGLGFDLCWVSKLIGLGYRPLKLDEQGIKLAS